MGMQAHTHLHRGLHKTLLLLTTLYILPTLADTDGPPLIIVTVGGIVTSTPSGPQIQNKFTFNPLTVTAVKGQTIMFNFVNGNHSVVESPFDSPCSPLPGGINLGYAPVPAGNNHLPVNRTLIVSDELPHWIHCEQVGPRGVAHCKNGMVFAINPPNQTMVDDFQQRAEGLIGNYKGPQHIAPGIVAGAVVGGLVFFLIVFSLVYYFCRIRKARLRPPRIGFHRIGRRRRREEYDIDGGIIHKEAKRSSRISTILDIESTTGHGGGGGNGGNSDTRPRPLSPPTRPPDTRGPGRRKERFGVGVVRTEAATPSGIPPYRSSHSRQESIPEHSSEPGPSHPPHLSPSPSSQLVSVGLEELDEEDAVKRELYLLRKLNEIREMKKNGVAPPAYDATLDLEDDNGIALVDRGGARSEETSSHRTASFNARQS